MTKLTSVNGTLEFGPGFPTMLVNDQLYLIERSESIVDPISRGHFDYFIELARWGCAVGLDMTAIVPTHPMINEVELLPRLARILHNETGKPIGLDTRNAEAIEATLAEMRPYKVIVWTVTAEQELLDRLLPIIKRYGAVVAGMPMGKFSAHVPMTASERLAEAKVILEACDGYGIPREDVVIDAICLPVGLLQPNSYQVTLETIAGLHQMGVTSQIGVGNAGIGMPGPEDINLAYLLGAMPWGLDMAFINPGIDGLIDSVRAMDMLSRRDPLCRRYLKHWRSTQVKDRKPE